jgi:hypothetical protein
MTLTGRDVRPLMNYCHMSHARKEQPQLERAVVKKLVKAQVKAAAPILPHWYRWATVCCSTVDSQSLMILLIHRITYTTASKLSKLLHPYYHTGTGKQPAQST